MFFYAMSKWLSLKMDELIQEKYLWVVLLAKRTVTAHGV